MNPYFWIFALYALLITPVGAQVHIRVDHGVHYRVRLLAAGMRVLRKADPPDREKHLQPDSVFRNAKNWDYALMIALVRHGHVQRLLRRIQWRQAEIRACISFEDAALTALTYAFIRTVMQTVARCRPLPIRGRVEMDFRHRGTAVSFRGIATARLGSLTAAAIGLLLAAAAERAKLDKEESYAASH